MRILHFIFFVSIINNLVAQDLKEKNIGDFHTLKVFDRIEVELIKSDTNKLFVNSEFDEKLDILNKNGILKIRTDFDKFLGGQDIKILLHYKSIGVIDVNEGGEVGSKDNIDQFEIELNTQEGGKIDLSLDTKLVSVKSYTGGLIKLTGKSKKANITVNTGGKCNAKDLISEDSKTTILTGGEIKINSSNSNISKITGGGNIYVYGNPKTIDKKTTFGGKIHIVK